MYRPVHCEFMRSEVLDLTTIIPATLCHHRSYVMPYRKCITQTTFQTGSDVRPDDRLMDTTQTEREQPLNNIRRSRVHDREYRLIDPSQTG